MTSLQRVIFWLCDTSSVFAHSSLNFRYIKLNSVKDNPKEEWCSTSQTCDDKKKKSIIHQRGKTVKMKGDKKENLLSDIDRIRKKKKVDMEQRIFWIFWDMGLKLNERQNGKELIFNSNILNGSNQNLTKRRNLELKTMSQTLCETLRVSATRVL